MKTKHYSINEQITAKTVRLVTETSSDIVPIKDALALAKQQELDLIELSPNAVPPVVKIADYKKFIYQQNKLAKPPKQKESKTVQFGPQTDEHDYNFKVRHIRNFIEKGHPVKALVFFKGRSIMFAEQGEILLLRIATEIEDIAKVEKMPKLEGRRMNMFLSPKTKKNGTK